MSPIQHTLPTLFLGHGGGPMPLIGHASHSDLIRTWAPGSRLHSIVHDPNITAILVVSAHHESADGAVEVMTDAEPKLLFDYSGFPPHAYDYTLPNPGSPTVARRTRSLLADANIPTRAQQGRGHDHGVFVPMLGLQVGHLRPDLPIVSVSLRGPGHARSGLTAQNLALGAALAPLRGEGVLIVGSGNSIHGRCTGAQAQQFDSHLNTLAGEGPLAFERWAEHPAATACHGRPEHLVPLLVCAAAAPTATVESIQHSFMNHPATHFVFHGD